MSSRRRVPLRRRSRAYESLGRRSAWPPGAAWEWKGDDAPCVPHIRVGSPPCVGSRPPEFVPDRTRTVRLWLVGAAVVFFLVPFIGTDLIGLQPDLYYLIYFTIAAAWFVVFVVRYTGELRELWRHNLGWSLAAGAAVGVGVAALVFSQAGTGHPHGWQFGFEIMWRGLVYGTVDALTLFVFPAAVAYLLMRGNRNGALRKVGFAALTLALSMLVVTTYHLGYSDYRGEDLRSPETGAIMYNIPTVLTGNPLGAVVAHGTTHVAAVIHQRDGGDAHMLPPQATASYPDHGDGDLAAGLAAGWLIATAGALTLMLRRHANVVIRSPSPHPAWRDRDRRP